MKNLPPFSATILAVGLTLFSGSTLKAELSREAFRNPPVQARRSALLPSGLPGPVLLKSPVTATCDLR